MRSNLRRLIALLLVASALPAAAQTNGGSTYSIFNIGDLQPTWSAAAMGHGGLETAMVGSDVNTVNPAGWSDLNSVTVQADLVFEQYKVSDATSSFYQNNTSLRNFAAAFPWSEKLGGTVGLVLQPYSTVNYSVRRNQQVQLDSGGTADATLDFSGSGGISQAVLGTSFRPIDRVTVGAAAIRYIGTIERQSDVTFADGSLNPATYTTDERYGAWGWRVGALLEPIDHLRIGANFEGGADLSLDNVRMRSYSTLLGIVSDTNATTSGTVTLPPRISVGAAYRSGEFQFGGEAVLQNWSGDVFSTAAASTRIAAGVDRLADLSPGASGVSRWILRLGGYYDDTYYQIGSNQITEWAGTVGVGIPLTRTTGLNVGSFLDLAAEVGMRGTTDTGLTRELFGKLYIQLSVSELWFQRRDND